jgi:hypothetical protein
MSRSRLFLTRLATVVSFLFLSGSYAVATAQQQYPTILTGSDLTHVVPTTFYFQGQSAPTQMRNSAAVRLADNSLVIAALVDTSGYSSEVRGKYEGFFITDSPIKLGGSDLSVGAYGFGFTADGKVNIFDVGGKQVMSAEAHKDTDLKRPRPLMMVKGPDGVRLYDGRNYVTFQLR